MNDPLPIEPFFIRHADPVKHILWLLAEFANEELTPDVAWEVAEHLTDYAAAAVEGDDQ